MIDSSHLSTLFVISASAAFRPVDLPENLWQHLFSGASVPELSVSDHDDLIGNIEDTLLMGNDHNIAMVLLMELFKNLDQILEAPQVDPSLRLVKNSHGGIPRHNCGDLDTF